MANYMAKPMSRGLSVHALIWQGNRFLLTQRPGTAKFGANQWDLPGGKLEVGEDPLLGLSREIAEETGLRVQNFLPLFVHHKIIKELQRQQLNIIFECEYFAGHVNLSNEHQNFSWVTGAEASLLNVVDYVVEVLAVISERQRQEINIK